MPPKAAACWIQLLGTVTVEEPETSPAFVSASLDHNTRVLTITFSETIDASTVNTGLLYISETGRANQFGLARAAFDQNAADSGYNIPDASPK